MRMSSSRVRSCLLKFRYQRTARVGRCDEKRVAISKDVQVGCISRPGLIRRPSEVRFGSKQTEVLPRSKKTTRTVSAAGRVFSRSIRLRSTAQLVPLSRTPFP